MDPGTPDIGQRRPRTGRRIAWTALVAIETMAMLALLVTPSAVIAADDPPPTPPAPTIVTDKAEYLPGEDVILSGANWTAGTTVHITVADPAGPRAQDVTADEFGAFIAPPLTLPPDFAVAWEVTAADDAGTTASTTITPAPPPDPTPAPTEEPTPEPTSEAPPGEVVPPSPDASVDPTPTATPDVSPTPTPTATTAPVYAPKIVSDKDDYLAGTVATLIGTDWQPGEAVHISVIDEVNGLFGLEVDVTADTLGAFTYSFVLPDTFIVLYGVTATGVISGVATTTFMDMAVGTYDQCSNDDGDGYATGDTGCRWINGNLQRNNSTYAEGDSTVQRLWLEGLVPGISHTFTFKYGTTKGGSHAYDFLTTWDWSEDWITIGDRCEGITGCATAAETTTPIPVDPNAEGFDVVVGSRNFTMRGGTVDSATVPAVVSGDYTGDSETIITITVRPDPTGTGPMCQTDKGVTTCGVVLWFGAHVALTSQWFALDGTTGAGGISGSPYHVSLDAIDGASVGERDNQMQSGAVLANGNVVIVKDAIPNDAQDFAFNLTNGSTLDLSFSLDDDADPTVPNSQTFSLPAGTYTASELSIPAGWNLTNLVCTVVGTNGSSYTTNLAAGTATISLNTGFTSSDTVTCTYTDTKGGTLTVTKTASTSLTRTYSWTIDKQSDGEYWKFIGDPTTSHGYTVSVDKTTTDSAWAVSGNIVITNPTTLSAKVTGVSDELTGGITAAVSCPVTFPYSLAGGGSLTCTYTAALPDATTRTNTATVTTDGTNQVQGGSGTAEVNFTSPTVIQAGSASINVTDTYGGPWTASDDASWTYSRDFTCPTDTSVYTDGVYNAPDTVNTATITETGASDTATVKLHCYAPVASKTASASYTRTYTWDITKGPDGHYDRNAGESATHGYTVSVDKTTTDSAFVVSGVITVNNPNPNASMTVAIADSVGGVPATLDCGGTLTVPAGSSGTCGYTATMPDATAGTNTATVTLNSIGFTATKAYAFVANVVGYDAVNVTDTNGQAWGPVSDDASWPYNKTFTCSSDPYMYVDGLYTITHVNTATITETGADDDATVTVDCHLQPLAVTKTASPTFQRIYDWTIEKKADKTQVYSSNGGPSEPVNFTVSVTKDAGTDSLWSVSGTISVTNPNGIPANGVILSDATPGGTCTVVPATVDIPANGNASATYVCTFAANPGSGTNTATATWDGQPSTSGTADFTFGAPTTVVNGEIDVTDTNGGAWHFTDSGSVSYQLTYNDPAGTCADHTNTATITQLDKSSSVTVTDCQGVDLTVTKTATPSFTRTWTWEITKDWDGTYSLNAGGSVLHGYKVTVTPTSTDSAWQVVGIITISNPNDWQAIVANVSDAVDNGGTCVVDQATVTVPASGSVDVGYTCTWATQPPSYLGTNTATAAWDGAAHHTPSDSASGDASFTFQDPTEVDPIITVTDDKAGDLGSADRAYAEWFYDTVFTCSANPADYTNGSYSYSAPNKATINETGQYDTANVDVTCSLDALEVTKTAAGTYDRTVTWELTKSVDPASHEGAAGDSFQSTWTVVATKTDSGQLNHKVAGTISIHNPGSIAQTFTVADTLDDGTPVTINCPSDTVAAGGTVVCTYEAVPDDDSATLNTAVVTAAGNAPVTATAPVPWTETLTGSDSGDLTDPRFTYDENVNVTTTVTFDETFTCSTDASRYTNGSYTESFTNNAYFKNVNTDLTASAQVGITCHLPALTATKDATATYKQDITWTLEKTVSDDSHSGSAGGVAGTSTWQVVATKTIGDPYGWLVVGKIYINNPAAIPQTFTVADILDDMTVASVACPDNTVPAGGNVECTYTASPAGGTATLNTATVKAVGNADIIATAPVSYGSIHVGSETAVLEDGLKGYSEEISETTVLTWDQTFSCSSDQSSYTNGSYGYDVTNTATLKYGETTLTRNVTVGVDCTLLPLVPTKTAQGEWDRTVTWTLTKSVDPASHEGNAGDDFQSVWNVLLTKIDSGQKNWKISGEISIHNPSAIDQTFTVADTLDDGTPVTVSCPSDTVVAGGTVVCTYTAAPDDASATLNTATVSATGNADVTTTADVPWKENLTGSDSGDLTDPRFTYTANVSATTSVDFNETFTCSTDPKDYINGSYTTSFTNDAFFRNFDHTLVASAEVGLTCHLPALQATKTAQGEWDRTVTWTLTKSVDPASHTGYYGETAGSSTWTVVADKTDSGPTNYKVSGEISINNPAAIAQTFSVADTLDDGTLVAVTCPSNTVAAGATVKCTYTAAPDDATATLNTATVSATGNGDVTTTAAVPWKENLTGYDSGTLSDPHLAYSQTISGDTTETFPETFTCPADASKYVNGTYTYEVPNTATLNSGIGLTASAKVTVTCHQKPKLIVQKNAKPAQGSFAFTTTGTGYIGFTLTGSTAGGGNVNTQELMPGTYTVKESTQLGWILTGIGGGTAVPGSDDNRYYCTNYPSGSNATNAVGDLPTMTATVTLDWGQVIKCVFENTGQGVTRTQGFWATHTKLAEPAWFGGTSNTYPSHTFPGVASVLGDTLICGRPIDTLGKLMGGFWSDISKKSDGRKRTALDQARMQLLQQLLAAELNASAFGSVPPGGIGMFTAWENALCGTDLKAIQSAQQGAASFNSSGDNQTFTPGTSADSQYARSVADRKFWDIIKP